MKKVTEEDIMRFMDGYPDEQERLEFLKRLEDDPEAAALYHDLMLADQYMTDLPLESPSEDFNEQVLVKVRRVQRSLDTNRWLIMGVGVLVALIALTFLMVGQFDAAASSEPETTIPNLDRVQEILPSMDLNFNGILEFVGQSGIKQLIIIVDIFIAFLFIDRFLMKNFFRSRTRTS